MMVKKNCRYITFGVIDDTHTEWHCRYWDKEFGEPCHCEACIRYERNEENPCFYEMKK